MNTRGYKWGIVLLLCLAAFLAWRCLALFAQVVTADFIDKQCKITEDFCNLHPGLSTPETSFLAMRLEFLVGYYESRSNALAGSHLEQIVRRDYEQALTNTLTALRRQTTNDLGSDPRAWIQKHGK